MDQHDSHTLQSKILRIITDATWYLSYIKHQHIRFTVPSSLFTHL